MQATTLKRPEVKIEKQPEPKKKVPKFLTATAVMAVLIFLAINLGIWVRFGDDKVSHDLWNGAGSIDIAIKAYSDLQQKPRVVLLGSSLMMYPFWAADKQADPNIGDIFNHRQSKVLQAALAKNAPDKENYVFSFAIFGQMISDAYIYVNEYLKDSKAPEYLVFGIAPRDFHDNDLPAPMATYSFKRLVDLNNFPQYAQLFLPTLQDKCDWLMGRLCYFYGHRWRLQHDVSRSLTKAYGKLVSQPATGEAAPEKAGFMLAAREDVRWKSSLAEYRRRYTNIENKDMELQLSFLARLLELCNQRQIKVVLVNMPLTGENRELLPDGFYRDYSQRIGAVATKYGAKYLDLGDSKRFEHADFWDTTHLNHFGGNKLIGQIAPHLN